MFNGINRQQVMVHKSLISITGLTPEPNKGIGQGSMTFVRSCGLNYSIVGAKYKGA